MESNIVVIITGGMALVGNVLYNVSTHSKNMYRTEQLEKKQDIHNQVIERVYQIEKVTEVLDERQRTANHRIDDLERMSSHE